MTKGLPRSLSRGLPALRDVFKMAYPIDHDITVTTVTTGIGWGTVVLSGLPQGNLLLLGAVAYLTLDDNGSADISETFDGDYGIGTVPNADTDLADAGDDDIIPSTALGAATAGTSPSVRGVSTKATEQGVIIDNTAGDLELNLNVLIDAADQTDDTAVVMKATGVAHVAFVVLGDD